MTKKYRLEKYTLLKALIFFNRVKMSCKWKGGDMIYTLLDTILTLSCLLVYNCSNILGSSWTSLSNCCASSNYCLLVLVFGKDGRLWLKKLHLSCRLFWTQINAIIEILSVNRVFLCYINSKIYMIVGIW